ncbi:MAG: CoA transferase [Dehalococcoidia bacterium]|nr:CoA transferase [Dehalococcoidia bacterium]
MTGADSSTKGVLDGIRVLDLAGPMGVYCGKLWADMGADVIKVEPLGGDPMRRLGPFYHDEIHPEKSLYFFHYNTSKRSVTLNLESADGRELFKKLVKSADIILETFPPGYMEGLSLGYTQLKAINPSLIMTSITPFGHTGPYRDYKSSDLVGQALGGWTNTVGNVGERPTWPANELGYHHVSISASAGTLIALYHRDMAGEGQHVDVSMHEASSMVASSTVQSWDVRQEITSRRQAVPMRGGWGIFQCKDGYIYSVTRDGPPIKFFFEWLDEDGVEHDFWDPRWQDPNAVDAQGVAFRSQPENIEHMNGILRPWFMTHTKEELASKGQDHHLSFIPYNDPKEIVEDPQLEARNFFIDIEHPLMEDTPRDAGAPFNFSKTPWRIGRRPPLVGEHNQEIYIGEMGYSNEQLALLKAAGAI